MLLVDHAKTQRAQINDCNRFDITDLNRPLMTGVSFKYFIIPK